MADKASIGQTLRERREERGLSPEQAAFQSRVPLRLLQALEADDYRLLPDAAYLIRFLQDYARLLKLDPDVLAAEFRKAIRRPPGTSLVAVPPPTPPLMIPWKQVLWTLAAILVITPLVFIVLSLASKRAAERRPRAASESDHRRAGAGNLASPGPRSRAAAAALPAHGPCRGGHLDGGARRWRAGAPGPPAEGTDGAIRGRHRIRHHGGERGRRGPQPERAARAIAGDLGAGGPRPGHAADPRARAFRGHASRSRPGAAGAIGRSGTPERDA
ncbi:MAG: helix-turn-helix domain-containing protein [candidate division NC10 bacterium]|nr:helix-turn-helix domain-containing protein [candidate division NC10 bacterium]